MKRYLLAIAVIVLIAGSPALVARDDGLAFHEDYYLGFSQGAYYGLMLAGAEYDVAWCVKGELAYAADSMGVGGEFQEKMQAIFDGCSGEQ